MIGSEVWLAEHAKTREQRVYKFALDGDRLRALKREATLMRVLQDSLPDQSHFIDIVDWNFASTPFYAVTELLKQSFVWREHEDPEARAVALARALEAAGLKASDALPQVAPLLDLPLPPGFAPVTAVRSLRVSGVVPSTRSASVTCAPDGSVTTCRPAGAAVRLSR